MMRLRSVRFVTLLSGAAVFSISSGPGFAQDAGAPPVAAVAPSTVLRFGNWGVDLSVRDLSVKPGDDFERFASGKWIDATPIPADKSSAGVGTELNDRNQEQLRDIVTQAPAGSALGALYQSFMDEARIEQLGTAPLQADLAKIEAIGTREEFETFMAGAQWGFGATLFRLEVIPDLADPTVNTLMVGTSGLGLPDRDYYLLDSYKPQRDAYRAYVERTLDLIGMPGASDKADQILAFETEIAKLSWSQADLRDIDKLNNPMSPAQLGSYAPGLDWTRYLKTSRTPSTTIVVGDNTAVKALAALYSRTPLQTLKTWQQFKVADQASPYLPKRFVDSRFAFTRVLTGATEQRPRWRRAIAEVDTRLGELLGAIYVQCYFSPQAKAKMEALVANLKLAAADRIRGNAWMEQPTKDAALRKLARMDVMVGYPEKFRDYSALALRPDDLYGNVTRSRRFDWDYRIADLGKPVDHKKWEMSPATVNAYNGGLENKIVFPAGILQPPFFDPAADPAVNYGAAGAIIGHEIMHGFDDQGRKIDENGAVRDWWTPRDAERFKALTAALGKQYAGYEAAPGVFINGDLTMGENIGDMSGLEVAYTAYRKSLGGKAAPVIDGLTGEQRFFLAYAQAWRGKARPEAIKTQVASDPHSPRRFRILGPLRNLDAWYVAFSIGPDSKFYIPPAQRVRIW